MTDRPHTAEYACPACKDTRIIGAESNPGRRYCPLCDYGAARFRKKPVEIDAINFDGTAERGAEIILWVYQNGGSAEYHPFLADHFKGDPKVYMAHPDPYMRIVTLEGTMVASKGDWVIRGVQGEFYPCKPDIFEATYERVHSESSAPSPTGRNGEADA